MENMQVLSKTRRETKEKSIARMHAVHCCQQSTGGKKPQGPIENPRTPCTLCLEINAKVKTSQRTIIDATRRGHGFYPPEFDLFGNVKQLRGRRRFSCRLRKEFISCPLAIIMGLACIETCPDPQPSDDVELLQQEQRKQRPIRILRDL